MYKAFQVHNRATFTTSDLNETPVNFSGVLDRFEIAMRTVETAVGTPTLPEILAKISNIKVKQAGQEVVDISCQDLCVLDILALNQDFFYLLSAADNQYGMIADIQIPMFLSRKDGGVSILIENTDTTKTDGEDLTCTAVHRNPKFGIDQPLMIKTQSYTPSGTGSLQKAFSYKPQGEIIGIMFFSTTIPTTTAQTISLDKLVVEIDGIPFINEDWLTLGCDSGVRFEGDTVLDGILDNYRYLNLVDDPVPSKSDMEIKVNAGDTNVIRMITIERLPAIVEKKA